VGIFDFGVKEWNRAILTRWNLMTCLQIRRPALNVEAGTPRVCANTTEHDRQLKNRLKSRLGGAPKGRICGRTLTLDAHVAAEAARRRAM